MILLKVWIVVNDSYKFLRATEIVVNYRSSMKNYGNNFS